MTNARVTCETRVGVVSDRMLRKLTRRIARKFPSIREEGAAGKLTIREIMQQLRELHAEIDPSL